INLIVGDILKIKDHFVSSIQDAIKVVKWFNNHSHALGLLRKVQLVKLFKVMALILPILTRWISYHLAISQLIELELAFWQLLLDSRDILALVAGGKAEVKEKAWEIINILEQYNFWLDLK
ncbi:hypothetical protein H0H87_002759, partial [Tephrocybe sp. NHM501043]